MEKTACLDDLLLAHIESTESEQHGWSDNLLHLSDLGGCPRAVMLRLQGAEKRPLGGLEKKQQAYRFFLANFLHEQCTTSWTKAGILLEKECSLRGFLPAGWTGRFDCIINYDGGPRICDIKTVEYIALRSYYPKAKHMMQVVAYHTFAGQEWGLTHDPIVFYIQRNLMHKEALECRVSSQDHIVDYVKSKMRELDECRSALPELPPILNPELKYTGKKEKGQYGQISEAVNHLCETKWCDFSLHSCQPALGIGPVANLVGDGWAIDENVIVCGQDAGEMREKIQTFLSDEVQI